jgi:peptide/nickel transport system permease protein
MAVVGASNEGAMPMVGKPEGALRHSFRLFMRSFLGNKLAVVALVIVLVAALYAVFGSHWTTYDPEIVTADRLQGPSFDHLLGTDNLGRDLYSRAAESAHVSMSVAAIATLLAIVMGVPVGLVAGYASGIADLILMRIIDALYAIPSIILALSMLVLLGNGIFNIGLAISLIYVPVFARLIRGETMLVRNLDYVSAARALGASPARIIIRHIWPNVRSPIIVQASLALGFSILIEAALSYLGFGVNPAVPTWGRMTRQGYSYLSTSPWVSLVPGLIIFLVVLSFNVLGDALRDALDPRSQRRRH